MTELRRFGADRGSRLPGMLALTVAGALTAGVVACGGAPEVEPETAVDTLALLDRELDLAMSGDTAPAELRDSPRGSRESGERPGRRPERRSPPPPAPPSSSPETPPAKDPATAERASAEPEASATGESSADVGEPADEVEAAGQSLGQQLAARPANAVHHELRV